MSEIDIPNYQIVREIGRGGMAIVYLAMQMRAQRHVAIKVINPEIRDDQIMMERFVREAKLIPSLEHLHILPVIDCDPTHNPPYIIMRYLEGGTLDDVMSKERLSVENSLRLMQEIASALGYAHTQGVIHRDVKPSNILLDKDGHAFVTDFGIARRVQRLNEEGTRNHTTLTERDFTVGTPDYMSPEQGRALDIDYRTDIYSMGVMLFQMLTGQRPYNASTPIDLIIQHISAEIPSARELNQSLPPGIDDILRKAMAKKPEDRYRTAEEMAQDLKKLEKDLGTRPYLPVPPDDFGTNPDLDIKPLSPSLDPQPDPYERVVTILCVDFEPYQHLVEQHHSGMSAQYLLDDFVSSSTNLIKDMGGELVWKEDNKFIGMWGIHVAQNRDAEYAVSTGLQLQRLLRQKGTNILGHQSPIPLRVGIHVGRVLMTPTANKRGYQNISGEAMDMTIALMDHADASILVSSNIFRSARQSYEFEAGPVTNMGRHALPSYRVRMRRPKGTAPLVSHKPIPPDIRLLADAYDLAIRGGQTRIMTVRARSAMTKSRLLEEFFAWVRDQPEKPYILRGYSVQPERRIHPYALLRDMLADSFDIAVNDSATEIQSKVEDGFAELAFKHDHAAAHYLGNLLGFDLSHSPHIAKLRNNPTLLQDKGRESFFALMDTLAQNHPTIIHLEDIQWADAESVELINELADRYPDLPLLIVCRYTEKESAEKSLARRPRRHSAAFNQLDLNAGDDTSIGIGGDRINEEGDD